MPQLLGPAPTLSSQNAGGIWRIGEVQQNVANVTWASDVVRPSLGMFVDSTNSASWSGSGTTWYDLSGNSLHLTGTTGITAGQGLLSGNTWTTATTSLLNTDNHTIGFAFRMNTTTSLPTAITGWDKLFSYNAPGTDRSPGIWRWSGYKYLHWRYDPTNSGSNVGEVSNLSDTTPNTNTEFSADTWYYITGSKDSSGNFNYYVNGNFIGSSTVAATKLAGNAPIILMESFTAGLGSIDFVTVYNRVLSASEVKQNYMAWKSRLAATTVPCGYLVVGGGGGGGKDMAGGGGAGGFNPGNTLLTRGSSYTVTVGRGGYGSPAASGGVRTDGVVESATNHQFQVSATNGLPSSISGPGVSVTGGGGGYGGSSYWSYSPNSGYGSAGASGGGASGYNDGSGAGRYGTANGSGGLGNRGGQGGPQYYSGGGGGAGASGSDSTGQANGGIGIQSWILSTPYYWAGGGGGAAYSLGTGGNGGAGGGGGGAVGSTSGGSGINSGSAGGGGSPSSQTNRPGGDAGTNTGGGGGGGSHYNANNRGGEGGSGIVIIRYPDTFPDLTSIGAGLAWTKMSMSGHKLYMFTAGTGTIVV